MWTHFDEWATERKKNIYATTIKPDQNNIDVNSMVVGMYTAHWHGVANNVKCKLIHGEWSKQKTRGNRNPQQKLSVTVFFLYPHRKLAVTVSTTTKSENIWNTCKICNAFFFSSCVCLFVLLSLLYLLDQLNLIRF